MGTTQTIADKMKQDEEFRKYMSAVEADAKKEEANLHERVLASIDSHYEKNKWSHDRLFGNRQSDYQNYSDWGLDRINAIVESIGKALGAGDYPSSAVPGSDKADQNAIDTAKEFAGVFAGDYSLIVARVQALVSATLSQFSVKSETVHKSELKDIPLSGGLHLFYGSSGRVYEAKQFFSNEFIGSFQIVFESHVSAEESRAFTLHEILKATEHEIKLLNEMIAKIRTAQMESLDEIIKKDIKDFKSTNDAYNVAIASVKLDRDKVMQEYDKYKRVMFAVELLIKTHGPSEKPGMLAGLPLNGLFNEWEASIADRYLKEMGFAKASDSA